MRIRRRTGLVSASKKGLAITSVAVTVLDLAAQPGVIWREAVAVAADAVRDTGATAQDIAEALDARRAHPHRQALDRALGVAAKGAQSGLEVTFVIGVLEAHGLPAMEMQLPATTASGDIRREFEHERTGVVADVDGRVGHEGSGSTWTTGATGQRRGTGR